MVSQTITLTNGSGLHMRPAGVLAQAMAPFAANVTIVADGKEVNAKSLMAIVASGIKCGTEIEVRCEGDDEQAALDAAIGLIESGLGE
ncbi:HPr family phosphocarrier protein [Adlercreutzia sp. R25]|uniref:HPr family phosphocarrier protein n=1 Tax=Adlercreutzia shanghongiae TaxID=3111773 RepID=A0ABU6IXX2_9ACTN|nr:MULTISPECIES: HPr family phosphocarrier protein [unclassified Adlercreutzia]MEC4271687.1 HPr family phosphocarrier protein [Adlercreutzia sp. R25]MEC4294693.1 HPr family phosphocarrier protein [Adlercreutzia sp. R22]